MDINKGLQLRRGEGWALPAAKRLANVKLEGHSAANTALNRAHANQYSPFSRSFEKENDQRPKKGGKYIAKNSELSDQNSLVHSRILQTEPGEI